MDVKLVKFTETDGEEVFVNCSLVETVHKKRDCVKICFMSGEYVCVKDKLEDVVLKITGSLNAIL